MYVSKVYQTAVDSYGDVRTLVRGITYQCPDDWEDVLDSLDEDSNIYLVKEPDNPKDKLAIAAYLDDRRVGYVAASDNDKIWLYLTDEKMPCKFIERFDASFKISFENPRHLFEDLPFEEIYRDKDGVTDEPFPEFEIPFITNPKDNNYEWLDDRTYIMDLEKFIPDFRRKLAARMIILVGRKNSKDEYCYYLPYANNIIADIHDEEIKDAINEYGFVIALPDVPMIISNSAISMDLHVTFIKNTTYKNFDSVHQSELVFKLNKDDVVNSHENNLIHNTNVQSKMKNKESKWLGANSISIDKKAAPKPSSPSNDFFPIWGITLGKTTWKQAENMGYAVEIWKEGPARVMHVNKVYFWDHDGEGKFTSLYWGYDCDFTPLWKSKGFSWDNSYNEWGEVFKKLGFKIEVTEEPIQKEYSGHDILSAEFEATSPDGSLSFNLVFDYGDNGCYTSSPNTLYSISVNFEKPCSQVQRHDVEEESYEINDSPEGGKHVSMDVIVPEEGDVGFDFCTYECRISEKEQIDLITTYMKRYEEGKEPRAFLMIGRPLMGPTDLDIFYSLDGNIIFNFIFDERIKSWIKEAGFVLGKVKSYKTNAFFPKQLDVILSVSKRKSGETLFKQASEKAMDYIEDYTNSEADYSVETKIIDAVEDYKAGNSEKPYNVLIIPQNGITICTTLDGENITTIDDDEIIELAEKNKGVFGHITDVDYDNDGGNICDVWFTIRVSRSIPRITLEQDPGTSNNIEIKDSSSSLNDFFPFCGITLGKTTWKQAEDMGFPFIQWPDGDRCIHMGGVFFEDCERKGIFTALSIGKNAPLPPKWKSMGISWNISYNECMDIFTTLGFRINVTHQPSQEFVDLDTGEVLDRSFFYAEFNALSPDGILLLRMEFNGEDCDQASSPDTLCRIVVDYKGTYPQV